MNAMDAAPFVSDPHTFADLVGDDQHLVRVAVTDAHEGPVYVPRRTRCTSRRFRPRDVAIKRLSLSLGRGIGAARRRQRAPTAWRCIPTAGCSCASRARTRAPARISLVDRATGAAETVVDGWRGLPLNSPNDVVVKRDGTVWFTDPSYGLLQGFRPAPALGDFVYRHDPRTGETDRRGRGVRQARTGSPSRPTSASSTSATPAPTTSTHYDSTRPHHVRPSTGTALTARRRLCRHRSGLPRRPQGRRRRARLRARRSAGVQVFDPGGNCSARSPFPAP